MNIPFKKYLSLLNEAPANTLVENENERFQILPLKGGANNRVFLIRTLVSGADALSRFNANHSFVLKHYFTHPGDKSDRLHAEFSFCKFAWQNGIRTLPEPLLCDAKNRIGFYEYIEGVPAQRISVSRNHVEQVLTFFFEINAHKNQKQAQLLPEEKEACFSIQEHLDCVERRILGLKKIEKTTEIGRAASEVVLELIQPLWKKIRESIVKGCSRFRIDMAKKIHPQDRSLSHSDIGFHNAILTSNGKVRFIDFEYAGWGDPVKMVCDFFCAPKVPVPMKYFEEFSRALSLHLKEPANFLRRLELLLPLYRLKWCCILMNNFLPLASSRRQFSLGAPSQKILQKQLEKVKAAARKISYGNH